MLTDGRFWVGVVVGAAGWHFYLTKKSSNG